MKKEEIVVVPLWVGLSTGWVSEMIVWILSQGTRQPNMTNEGVRLSTINRTLDMEKAKLMLSYRPKVSILRGVEWYMHNKQKED